MVSQDDAGARAPPPTPRAVLSCSGTHTSEGMRTNPTPTPRHVQGYLEKEREGSKGGRVRGRTQPPRFQTLLRLQGQRQLRIPRPSAKPPGNPASRILCWVPGPPWTVPWPRKSREGSHSTSQSHVPHGGEVVSPQRDRDTASSSPRLSHCHSCGHP